MRARSVNLRPLGQRLLRTRTGAADPSGGCGLDRAVLGELVRTGGLAAIPFIAPVLIRGSDEEVLAAAGAIAPLLAHARPEDLPWLDERLRAGWSYVSPADERFRRLRPEELARWAGGREYGVLLLQLASCDRSGYVREEAVRRLADVHDGRELPYLLLRLNDWVEKVRTAAYSAVQARLREAYSGHFVANLALVSRLVRTQRADQRELLEAITRLLGHPAARAPLMAALHDPSRQVRRASFPVLMAQDGDDLAVRLLAALRAEDPVIRVWAVRRAVQTFRPEELVRLLPTLSADPAPAVRLEALPLWATAFAGQGAEWLRAALLDRNTVVRAQARFHLRGQMDFAQFYRDALATEHGRRLVAALSSLAETGGPADADRIAAYLSHPVARVRRTAIQGVMGLGGEAYVGSVLACVGDGAPSVSAEASKVVAPYAASLGAGALWALLQESPAEHVRMNVLRLFAALPKWEAICCLLQAAAGEQEAVVGRAREYVQRWTLAYNRSRSAPTREQIARLAALLPGAAAWLGADTVEWIRFGLRSV